jgi:hypothetical protein
MSRLRGLCFVSLFIASLAGCPQDAERDEDSETIINSTDDSSAPTHVGDRGEPPARTSSPKPVEDEAESDAEAGATEDSQ